AADLDSPGLRPEARPGACGTRLRTSKRIELATLSERPRRLVGALQCGQHADRCAVSLAAAVEERVEHSRWPTCQGSGSLQVMSLQERLDPGIVGLGRARLSATGLPGENGPLGQGEAPVGDDQIGVEPGLRPQAVAFRACAMGAVEAERAGLQLLEAAAAGG